MTQHRPEQPEVSRDPALQEAFDAFLHQTHVPRDFPAHVMTRVRQQRARHGLVGWWHRVWAWRLPLVVCGATVSVLLFLTLHVWKPAIQDHSLESAKEVPQV